MDVILVVILAYVGRCLWYCGIVLFVRTSGGSDFHCFLSPQEVQIPGVIFVTFKITLPRLAVFGTIWHHLGITLDPCCLSFLASKLGGASVDAETQAYNGRGDVECVLRFWYWNVFDVVLCLMFGMFLMSFIVFTFLWCFH